MKFTSGMSISLSFIQSGFIEIKKTCHTLKLCVDIICSYFADPILKTQFSAR